MKPMTLGLTEVCNTLHMSACVALLARHQHPRGPTLQHHPLGSKNVPESGPRERTTFELRGVASG